MVLSFIDLEDTIKVLPYSDVSPNWNEEEWSPDWMFANKTNLSYGFLTKTKNTSQSLKALFFLSSLAKKVTSNIYYK